MRPRPMMPTVLPHSEWVSGYWPLSQSPASTNLWAPTNWRQVISVNATAVSATSSLSTSGVLVTLTFASAQAASGMPS